MKVARAEILARGLVQGVGFRYFVYQNAVKLGLKGYVKNLFSGNEVLTIAEGEKYLLEELFNIIKIGPRFSSVEKCTINWKEFKNEFINFEIKH